MECFIVKEGVERKAGLEDILPTFGTRLQYILRDALKDFYLPYAIAYLPDEVKKIVYGNLLSRIRGRFEKEVEDAESKLKKDDSRIRNAREKLISFIGETIGSPCWYPDFVWKETKPKEPAGPVEKLIDDIERACSSGKLYLFVSDINKISKDDLKNTIASFQNRKNELQKIRSLTIAAELLPDAALFFEAGGIENLEINDDFNGIWPDFLEKYRNLTSISLSVRGLTEFPLWVRNAASLRRLCIYSSNLTLLPDWIGEMQSLTEIDISYNNDNLKTLPDGICNLKNLAELHINNTGFKKLPDTIGNLSSLKILSLFNNDYLTSLPDNIGDLKNLAKLIIGDSVLEKLPDSTGNLLSLTELFLYGNEKLTSLPNIGNLKNLIELNLSYSSIKALPDSIGNLHNITKLLLKKTKIEILPDSIGNLGNLTEISLKNCKKMKCLPDSIGRLKNLTTLNLSGSGVEKLPETIKDCSSLQCLDIRKTNIISLPDFTSSIKEVKRTIEVIPKNRSISYASFCNYYYDLVETIFRFSEKARREGLLALEEEMDSISDGFFLEGIRLVTDGTDWAVIRELLAFKVEREQDYYTKKLKEIAMEGILSIQNGDSSPQLGLMLAAMVNIKNNPLDAACAEYLAGDYDAFHNIDFKARPREEREEIRFFERVLDISEADHREGVIGIEQRLDKNGIAAKDVFEYGISLIVAGLEYKDIDKYLSMLIAHETDPMLKNLSLAKKEAV